MPNSNQKKDQEGQHRSKRGLASASKETRARVASEGGRASGQARREHSSHSSHSGHSSNRSNSDENRQ